MPSTEGRRVRAVHVGSTDTVARYGTNGVVYLTAAHPLGPYPPRITDWLDEWAVRAPTRPFLAQRDRTGEWRTVSYAQALQTTRALGQALLDRRLGPDRSVVILSGNGIGGDSGEEGGFGLGGSIYNYSGTIIVKNFSSITGSIAPVANDVYNLGVLRQDDSSTIGILSGNPAILI